MSFSDRIGALRLDDPAPLYVQLRHLIRDAVGRDILREGDAIPAERDLAIQYRVSRVTIRKAIGDLAEAGMLVRRRGAGTFVAARVEKSFSKLSSFSEDMRARGRMPTSSWIARSAGLAGAEAASALALSPDTAVYRFDRIRYADAVPMALEFSTVIGYCLPSLEAVEESIYRALGDAGNRPVRALQRLRAVPFGRVQARMLGVDTGSPGLLIERRSFLRDGRSAEYTRSYYRGDAYDFVAELSAP